MKMSEFGKATMRLSVRFHLVFPEYSIPVQILLDLRELAQEASLNIVAGSHGILQNSVSEAVFRELGISKPEPPHGTAIVPLLRADGTAEILSTKATASRWEPNLKTAELDPKIPTVNCGGEHIRLAAPSCSDAIDVNRYPSDNI